jgi:hypothetical protein
MPNRAQRRAMKLRAAQQPAPTSSSDSEGTAAASSEGRRIALTAIGLRVDADGNVFGTPDEKRELLPHIERVYATVKAFDAVLKALGPFGREWTSGRARELSAAVLAYADAFDAAKAAVERLNGESAPPGSEGVP